jgi:multidrug efflux pump subunit AcrA (membrane-fusion protein)
MTSALVGPARAVGRDQTRRFLLVVDGEGMVQYRPVEVGGLYDGMREIRSGLNPEERVVVDGVQRARPGEKVNATELDPAATTRPVTAVPAAASPAAASK